MVLSLSDDVVVDIYLKYFLDSKDNRAHRACWALLYKVKCYQHSQNCPIGHANGYNYRDLYVSFMFWNIWAVQEF